MTRLQRTILGMLTALLLAGCAAAVPTAEKRDGDAMTPAPAMEAVEPPSLLEDRSLFYEGTSLLSRSGQPDPVSARKSFVSFLQRYPKSRLQAAAEGFIRLIDEGETLREAGRQERLLKEKVQAERSRLLQENDQLKKRLRELAEKLQAETALAQENEQLRKDLQRLRALEIELEKRDRMLR
jgi:hypothetical protein